MLVAVVVSSAMAIVVRVIMAGVELEVVNMGAAVVVSLVIVVIVGTVAHRSRYQRFRVLSLAE